jgi:alpha-tubulin suppressor-like RCC1 family protein
MTGKPQHPASDLLHAFRTNLSDTVILMQTKHKPSNANTVNQPFDSKRWQDVNSNFRHAVAIDGNGLPYAWGDNSHGQLGLGDMQLVITKPSRIGSLSNVRSVACGQFHTLLVDQSGDLYGAGWSVFGALGNGQTGSEPQPDYPDVFEIMDADVEGPWKEVQAKGFLSMGVQDDDSLWLWGKNDRGAVGNGTTTQQPNPVKVLETCVQSSVGWDMAAAINANGEIYLWGDNASNQCSVTDSASLVTVTRPAKMISNAGRRWVQVSAGRTHVLAVDSDGGLWTWGLGSQGQLGLGQGTQSVTGAAVPVPLQTAVGSKVLRIFAGDLASGAITQSPSGDTQLWMWGSDKAGRVTGRTDVQGIIWSPVTPVGTAGMNGWFTMALGADFTLSLNNPDGIPPPP